MQVSIEQAKGRCEHLADKGDKLPDPSNTIMYRLSDYVTCLPGNSYVTTCPQLQQTCVLYTTTKYRLATVVLQVLYMCCMTSP